MYNVMSDGHINVSVAMVVRFRTTWFWTKDTRSRTQETSVPRASRLCLPNSDSFYRELPSWITWRRVVVTSVIALIGFPNCVTPYKDSYQTLKCSRMGFFCLYCHCMFSNFMRLFLNVLESAQLAHNSIYLQVQLVFNYNKSRGLFEVTVVF